METWKEHPAYKNYFASSEGRIASLKRHCSFDVLIDNTHGDILKQFPNKKGYLKFGICINGKCRHLYSHRFICECFHGLCKHGNDVMHSPDSLVTNNKPNNLKWGTHLTNCREGRKTKLQSVDVVFIHALKAIRGLTNSEIGLMFRVGHSSISRVLNGNVWEDIHTKLIKEFGNV